MVGRCNPLVCGVSSQARLSDNLAHRHARQSQRAGRSARHVGRRIIGAEAMNSEHGELVERLRAVESDPIGCGLARNWYRNPDGPEAADLIESLSLRMRECERELEIAVAYLQAAANWTDEDMANPIMAVAARNCAREGLAALNR